MDTLERKRAKLIQWKLQKRLTQTATDLGGSKVVIEEWTRRFIERYTEPLRNHHTLSHIYDMLEWLDANSTIIQDAAALTLSIFFHDWVFDPRAKHNEMESIREFREFATEIRLSETLSSKVARYIECTITHTMPNYDDTPSTDSDLKLFLDFDLEVLSRDHDQYLKYSKQIQAEYSYMEPNDYVAGRTQVLKSFLNRDRIHCSGLFHQLWERKARENIEQELASLEGVDYAL